MTARIAVHGHAYQPPREDPETGEIARQAGAAPFHDWNERITDECYRPLGAARLLDGDGTERASINLWGRLSFDLGPTLAVWMDRHAPDVATSIVAGDAAGGGAIAHPWVHVIAPLTNPWDRVTVIRWGIDDFRTRFGREPRSMWLPETAVDTATLESLVDAGIAWTLLAPHQIVEVRAGGSTAPAGHHPLRVDLPSGRSIVVVPYDGPLSHGVAFGGLLDDGERLAAAVVRAASIDPDDGHAGDDDPPLLVVATDAETFGHHHRFGEMALGRAAELWGQDPGVSLTTPQAHLDRYPVTRTGLLAERTSWSCAHGVERWRSDCGCRFVAVDGPDQRWRRPLRDVLDALAEASARLIESTAGADLVDPWQARSAYGRVLASPSDARERARAAFLEEHVARGGSPDRAIAWMEAERLRLEAWSSCAWFFDSPERIETQQVLGQARAAARGLDALGGTDVSSWFDRQLAEAHLWPAPAGQRGGKVDLSRPS